MTIISVRRINKNDWTRDKVKDDVPLWYQVPENGSVKYSDVQQYTNGEEAVNALVAEAKALQPDSPMIQVFVHGFMNSVPTAAETANAIQEGLRKKDIKPAMAFLIWPSDHEITRYKNDRNDARSSALGISRAWEAFIAHPDVKSGAVAVNCISHSMGNYVTNLSCGEIELPAGEIPRLFTHSIMVAADVNQDDLNVGQEGAKHCQLSNDVTFYYGGWDGAMVFSEFVNHGQKRLGRYGPHHWDRLFANTVGVAATDVVRPHTHDPLKGIYDVFLIVHSDYFQTDTFYDDVADVLRGTPVAEFKTRFQPAPYAPNQYRLKSK